MYFGNYRRLVYLAQTDDPVPDPGARRSRPARARVRARRTGLAPFAAAWPR